MSGQTIYSFPDFKEPEKTSSWSEKDKAERDKALAAAGVQLPAMKDPEMEVLRKRAAYIKERMSPKGALNLPPFLDEQRIKHGIPDGFFKSQASFDRIFVFPIDPFDGDEKLVPGSFLYRANMTKMKDMQEGHRGILISAGLSAADRLMSHGIEIGHIVTTNKNVPFARRCEVLPDGHAMYYLVMRDGDLAGSETLAEELREGKRRVVDVGGPDAYSHQIADNDSGQWIARKKISVYVNDTW